MMYADLDVRMRETGGQPDVEEVDKGEWIKNHQVFVDVLNGRPLATMLQAILPSSASSS